MPYGIHDKYVQFADIGNVIMKRKYSTYHNQTEINRGLAETIESSYKGTE